jgi:hypothetical protein
VPIKSELARHRRFIDAPLSPVLADPQAIPHSGLRGEGAVSVILMFGAVEAAL